MTAVGDLSTAAYVGIALRAAESGDGARLAEAVLSIPRERLNDVNEALAMLNDTSTPLGGVMLAASRGYRSEAAA